MAVGGVWRMKCAVRCETPAANWAAAGPVTVKARTATSTAAGDMAEAPLNNARLSLQVKSC